MTTNSNKTPVTKQTQKNVKASANPKIEDFGKYYIAPCDGINKVLSIKKLTKKEIQLLVSDLKKLLKDSKNVVEYVKTVVFKVLSEVDQKLISGLIKEFDLKNPEDAITVQNILATVYNAIVDIYPIFRVEHLCSDLNGFLNDKEVSEISDEEFAKDITKKTQKEKKATEITSLKQIENLKSLLESKIIGQSKAIESVCNAIKLKAAGFSNFISLFFIGRTGVGKSELARILGKEYGNFWTINCAEFANGHEVNKLLGAPPGYIGSAEGSILKDKSAKTNKWVILFDEIEKGSDKFFNFLLSLLDTGTCVDNLGNKIDFSQSIFIFTSNCGVRDIKTKTLNFNQSKNSIANKEDILKSLELQFSPEFRNRIDEFVYFNDLTEENARDIAELNLRNYPIKPSKDLIDFIVKNGYSEELGAREVRRFIKKFIGIPLADAILEGKNPGDGGSSYDSVVSDGKLQIINTSI